MNKKDLRALYVMTGSLAAYWVFCAVVIAQHAALGWFRRNASPPHWNEF